MFWKKRPVTHAVGLWFLVLAAAAALVTLVSYVLLLSDVRKGTIEAPPSEGRQAEQPPTLFGTILAFDGTVLKVDTKQPYDEVIVESDTTITTVGGSAVPSSALTIGATVTVTGKDLGDRRMSAAAIVILEDR